MRKPKTVALIAARGGSTRIPGKNIIDFMGEPLIARVIKACKGSGVFDRILVATDDEKIADVARRYGLTVPFKREFYVSDCMHTDLNGNPIEEMTALDRYYFDRFAGFKEPLGEYCLERLEETTGERYEAFCMFAGNTPFITAAMISELYSEFVENDRDYSYTAARCGKHPWFYCQGIPDKPELLHPEMFELDRMKLVPRTQELPEIFMPCQPMFYKRHCPADTMKIGYVYQSWEVNLDVDDYGDLEWFEKLFRGLDNS